MVAAVTRAPVPASPLPQRGRKREREGQGEGSARIKGEEVGLALKDKHHSVCQPANGCCVYSAERWTAARASVWQPASSTAYVGAIR